MNEISNVRLVNARNSEYRQFFYNVNRVLTQDFAVTHKITNLYDPYAALYDEFNSVFVTNLDYKETPEIEAADVKRDEYFLFLKQSVEVQLKNPIEAKRKAAEALAHVLKPYNSCYKETYEVESGLLADLLQKLFEDENVTHLTTLDLGSVVEQLTSANDAFQELYYGRSGERQDRLEKRTLKEIRPELDDAYRACAKAINALAYANEIATQDAEVAASLNAVIDGINHAIVELQYAMSTRRGSSSDEEEEETPAPDDTTPTDEPTA